ncbi:FtsW/RodA/SpoVE family cell cycle protein, partial [Candidatus Uhrbacteria bacterium]|nr:FtsW/RodA/SpoVE family cell cycle protein [Candidatus Uhrbacteria bacterium]
SMQPAEFVKVIAAIFLARYFTDYARALHQWRHLLLSGVGVSVFILLILAEPDFGSASIYFLLWLLMVFAIGIPLKRTLTIFGVMFGLIAFAWFFFFQPYQRERLLTFVSASQNVQGAGYHITQSLVAVGSGGFFGKGFGEGSQSQLRFLPAAETDFVFSVIAEEFGLLGIALFFGAWVLFFYRCFCAARGAPDNFGAMLAIAITIIFGIQFFMNVAMTVGLFPVTGVTLPLVSYGGSALLTHLIFVGILLGVIRHR